jgi:hypothetical protein
MSNDIRLFQFSNYVRPKLEENKSKNWVLNGKNNSFYQYVIDRFNGSPTNAAIIDSYINLIYGNGLRCRNNNTSAWINFLSILSPKEVRKIVSDFELFGEASFQVIKAKDKNKLGSIYHIPKQQIVPTLENEDGLIEGYWHSKDWSNTQKYPPTYYPSFGTSNESIEIYCIKPYKAGKNYFSDPDYLSALPYAEMEEELANFYINSIKKGLSAGYVIQVPDGGTRTPEDKDEFERKIKAKLTGSPNAMSFVIDFYSGEKPITVIPFPVNDAQHKQWEYLTGESRQQIMTSHKVVSPKLFGIMADGGFGNNANELDEAEGQLMKRVIQPKQTPIIEAFEEVINFYGIMLDLYFAPLTEQKQMQLSDQKKKIDLSDYGEDEDLENYELIDVKPVDYEDEVKLSTGTAKPLQKSRYDLFDTITRYRYAGDLTGERQFCKDMLSVKKIYRIEDIEAMSKEPVNSGFGPEGASTYDILKYKGGVNCHHYWEKLTYKRKNESVKVDVKSPIAIDKSKQQPAKGLAGIEPINMPNRGALNLILWQI